MFNLVLEVTDDGEPALTRYAQVIVTVNKEAEPVEETSWQKRTLIQRTSAAHSWKAVSGAVLSRGARECT